MKSPLNKPFYKNAPIKSVGALAQTLQLTERQLLQLARNASRMYRKVPIPKKDGTTRYTWDAQKQLKEVHGLINSRIFHRTTFPLFLQGGIRDQLYPRDYVRNADIHVDATTLVTLDIADFFPSTSDSTVMDIWSTFFRFPPVVAKLLTMLTTKDGFLPQGARTSSYLANLAFFRDEHDLVARLQKQGWRYSRLVDDITISSQRRVNDDEVASVNRTLFAFVNRHGYSVKRPKHDIQRRNARMSVNSLVVNKKVSLPKSQRRSIASLLHRTNAAISIGEGHAIPVNKVRGQIAMLKRMHPELGEKMLTRLKKSISTVENQPTIILDDQEVVPSTNDMQLGKSDQAT
ncbi:reverse transcriptase family protein [Burkholderia gladioli]|uniref:reverse transcriptase family protein n=1 Tax=Burkholderia gladioli TaxID=28095 RepID=UPI0016419022|nr:reverse transcriptase family protein [Burkholderia gladioli]MBJ9675502.1 RNA-directed DNA polymerase [Burkholderia gladioli]MDN7459072.1 reverse transcriptase family protein [Burkholderia gladioli]